MNKLSRECWPMINLKLTANPVFVLDLQIDTLKQPSASVNPASQ